MYWNAISAIAALISTIAIVISALYVRAELKSFEKDRYLAVTNQLFAIWQSQEFMEAQMWLLHRLTETTWESFVEKHRADYGEAAFHRIGSFYDRVGALTRLGLVRDQEMLTTMGGYVIAVWRKIEPLVHEARRLENSTLFADFERLLPACYECYIPTLGSQPQIHPFSLGQSHDRIERSELQSRLEKSDTITVLDVRFPVQVAQRPPTLPDAVQIPADQIDTRMQELPIDREIAVYCA